MKALASGGRAVEHAYNGAERAVTLTNRFARKQPFDPKVVTGSAYLWNVGFLQADGRRND